MKDAGKDVRGRVQLDPHDADRPRDRHVPGAICVRSRPTCLRHQSCPERAACRSGRSTRSSLVSASASACLDRGAVVLGPVRDAVLAVVLGDHVHPPLPDERHVAHDPRRGVPGQVAHHVVLQLLGVPDRHPPVLGVAGSCRTCRSSTAGSRPRPAARSTGRAGPAVVAFTPRMSTPWLRTSRTPTSSSIRAARATSGVSELTWLTWVCTARLTPRRCGGDRDPVQAFHDVALQPVLGQAHQGLGGQPDVAHGRHREQAHQVRLELLPRHVGDVAAGDHHVADARVVLAGRPGAAS